ncbi:MAG: GNAT family N-acetyltransferase [Flavobacteriales bacterium]
MNWILKKWEELEPNEIHAILKLRIDVFVVEQNCPYPELDGKDKYAYHLFCMEDDKALAVCRILPPGISYAEISIGRVATELTCRKTGLGKSLMHEALNRIKSIWGNTSITISAQCYLENFYRKLGFETISDIYLEDNIPHVKMMTSSY